MRHALAAALLSVVAAAACGAAGGTSPAGGLYGKVTKGPIMPVCMEGIPCDGPASGTTLLFSRDGVVVARTTTRKDGSYRIALRPGRYAVRTVPRAMSPPQPRAVWVASTRFRKVDFFVDTGIR